MQSSILREKSYGSLPSPYTISQILEFNAESKEIIQVYDTNPNLVALIDSDDGKIVLKRFGWRSFFHFLISPFMYSRARMSWETAIILDKINITSKPLFVHTKKKLGFKYENFFITKAIEPHIKLRRFFIEETNIDKLKTVLRNLACALAKMHKSGIYHRDLTTGNFLVDENLNIYLVDLNRARNIGKVSINKCLKDLSKIFFKNTAIFSQEGSIYYFFKSYAAESDIKIDWVSGYWKYRRRLVRYRKLSKRIKNILKKK